MMLVGGVYSEGEWIQDAKRRIPPEALFHEHPSPGTQEELTAGCLIDQRKQGRGG